MEVDSAEQTDEMERVEDGANRALAFHDLPVAADEGDEGRLSASARLVEPPSAWARRDWLPPGVAGRGFLRLGIAG
jgi:hypothetical protein